MHSRGCALAVCDVNPSTEFDVQLFSPFAPSAPAAVCCVMLRTLIGVVVLVVRLLFSLLSIVDEPPRALLGATGSARS